MPLTLRVQSPADESTVSQSPIVVRGTTAPGAVVSVDGALADTDAAGNFACAVDLEEGANVIEVVASDLTGAQLAVDLFVFYEP